MAIKWLSQFLSVHTDISYWAALGLEFWTALYLPETEDIGGSRGAYAPLNPTHKFVLLICDDVKKL